MRSKLVTVRSCELHVISDRVVCPTLSAAIWLLSQASHVNARLLLRSNSVSWLLAQLRCSRAVQVLTSNEVSPLFDTSRYTSAVFALKSRVPVRTLL